MAQAAEVEILKALTPGGVGVWTLVFLCLITLIKGWPALKKISVEADGSLRADLLARISDLEKQAAQDRLAFTNEMAAERKRCEEEIRELRQEFDEDRRALNEQVSGLLAAIRQNSQSTAYMIGEPDAVATTKASQKHRGEQP